MQFFSDYWMEKERKTKLLKISSSKCFPDFKPSLLSKNSQGNLYGPLPPDVLGKERDSCCIEEQVIKVGDKLVLVLDNVFSREEIEKILDLTAVCGYDDLSHLYPTDYRNNDRVMIEDSHFVDVVYDRIKSHVEKFVSRPGACKHWNNVFEEAEKTPLGLNNRMRICMYQQGGVFGGHYDSYVQFGNVRSRFTCMAYLNDVEVEQGGATRFYSVVPSAGAAAFDLTPHADVQPKLGRIVIFDHQIFHEGIELHGDAKHILRTDVLFRLSSPSDYTSFTSDTSATVDVPEGMKTPDKKIRCTKN